jgi:hypothetical protein
MAEGVDGATARRVVVTSAVRYIIPAEISGYFRILDLERERVTFLTPVPESTWRGADPNPRGGTRGARGVSVHGNRIVLANAERLFVLDTSWRLLAELSDRLMSDVHDVLAEERGIWVAATGCDMLLLVRWDGRLEHAWSLRTNRKLLKQLGFRERSLPAIDPGVDFRDPRARGNGFERLHVNSLGRAPAGLLVSLGRVASEMEPPVLSSVLVGVTEGGRNGSPHVSILHRHAGTAAPNHNVGEEGDLLVYNDSNRHCLVAYDRASGSERCAVPIPGEPSFARGLAQIGPELWLVGSQAPLAVHAVDLERAEVVGSFPLGGVQDETVYAICVLPDEFEEPRQPLGSDPLEFWRRAGASPAVTPIRAA